jgi:molybdate transport system regulatory protein
VRKKKQTSRSLRLRIRIVGTAGDAFGPGKAQLLEKVAKTGSLRQAAAELDMSYMKAWRLANTMNANFRSHLLARSRGGINRGGTQLTELGQRALAIYHQMTSRANQAAQMEWKAFSTLLKK